MAPPAYPCNRRERLPSEDYTEPTATKRDGIFDADGIVTSLTARPGCTRRDSSGPEGRRCRLASLRLPEEILEAVTDMGFRVPTPGRRRPAAAGAA